MDKSTKPKTKKFAGPSRRKLGYKRTRNKDENQYGPPTHKSKEKKTEWTLQSKKKIVLFLSFVGIFDFIQSGKRFRCFVYKMILKSRNG